MKLRDGFVSNSSTSSFICKVCGEIEAERDASPSDFGMEGCECGHYWHKECMDKACKEYVRDEDLSEYDEITSEKCPVCNLLILTKDAKAKYLARINKLTDAEILSALREEKAGKEAKS